MVSITSLNEQWQILGVMPLYQVHINLNTNALLGHWQDNRDKGTRSPDFVATPLEYVTVFWKTDYKVKNTEIQYMKVTLMHYPKTLSI